MRQRIRSMIACGALTAALAGTTLVAAETDVVAQRVAGFRELGAAFKNANDELKSGTPQPYVIQLSARQIRSAASAIYGWFPPGSGPQPGVKTAAKPGIWEQPDAFKAAQDALAAAAGAFSEAASSGDMDQIQTQARRLGEACSACHRQFRVEQD
jgi:cytochrome c556